MAEQETKPTQAAKTNPATEEIYAAEEFARRPDMFGDDVRGYSVLAAFRYAGKEKATKAEAREIVMKFRNKKVGD
jgi:hypothetical protein